MKFRRVTKLENCARCGETHYDIRFYQLTREIVVPSTLQIYSHWAPCPTNGEPILMRIEAKESGTDTLP